MSNKDSVESDWTGYFTRRFGRDNTRRNMEIYTPIVVNLTIPQTRYNNGTVHPPEPVLKNYKHMHPSSEPLINDDIPFMSTLRGVWQALDTNPNYKGDGYYFPEYQKSGVLFDYPEWFTNSRQPAVKPRKQFPLEIRRRLYF